MCGCIGTVDNCVISLGLKDITICNNLCGCINNYELTYTLFSYTDLFENEQVTFYAIYVGMNDTINNKTEQKIVYEITTDEYFAKDILNIIHKNLVTPITLKDCVYDLLVERYW